MEFQLTGARVWAVQARLLATRIQPIRNTRRPDAHCAVIFCVLGSATAIMIARIRVMEKITLVGKPTRNGHISGGEDQGLVPRGLACNKSTLRPEPFARFDCDNNQG